MLHPAVPHSVACELSICISTRNRASFIGETLESIISQATDECEIVVLDGASTDGTEGVVSEYQRRFERLRYFRQEVNDGPERGFDHAVELASGEFCWLMPDDDLLKPGAIATVLSSVRKDYSLVLVNVEYTSFDMSRVLRSSDVDTEIKSDREFGPTEMDELFRTCWKLVRYLGSVVIKRSIWCSREKEKYIGSYWVVVGVIFQSCLPGSSLLIAEPQIKVRMENQSWMSHIFSVLCVTWPSLVSTLAVSAAVQKECLEETELWRDLQFLMACRASGQYSLREYREYIRPRLSSIWKLRLAALIAVLDPKMLNACLVFYYSRFKPPYARSWLLMLGQNNTRLQASLGKAEA